MEFKSIDLLNSLDKDTLLKVRHKWEMLVWSLTFVWHASPWDDELILSKQTCDGMHLQLGDLDLIELADTRDLGAQLIQPPSELRLETNSW